MSRPERFTQNRVVAMLPGSLGYGYLGDAGFQCFTDSTSFRRYVESKVLAGAGHV